MWMEFLGNSCGKIKWDFTFRKLACTHANFGEILKTYYLVSTNGVLYHRRGEVVWS